MSTGLSGPEFAKALETARSHERSGDWQRALDWFKRLGAAEDVVRLLAGRRDFRGAAEYLLAQLPGRGFDTAKLTADGKKRALNAALLLARADDTEAAVRLLVSLGEKTRAAEVLEKAGDFDGAAHLRQVPRPASRPPAARPPTAPPLPPPSAPTMAPRASAALDAGRRLEAQGNKAAAMDAYVQAGAPAEGARVAAELGHHARASSLFVQAAKFYEAAVSAWRAGDATKAFELIQRVPATDAKYRQAAADAVRLAMTVPNVSISFEYFIGPFVSVPAESEKDIETLYALAQLYDKLGLPQNAVEALQNLLAVSPGYRDAAAWVTRLSSVDVERLKKVAEDDHAFDQVTKTRRGATDALPDLPNLPDLPDLPAMPPPPGPSAPRAQPPRGQTADLGRTGVLTPMTAGGALPKRATLAPQDGARVVAGRYRLDKRLGQGGMGEVFKAFDLELNDTIAIKLFIMPEGGGAEAAVARFKQEAKLARRLVHENIVRLFDFGVDGGTYFITMELLSGHELREEMRGPMSPQRTVTVLTQALRALHAAHQQGVIHRDIKPENLFITEGDVLKVMDFGIAKGQAAGGNNLTQQGTMAGTPKYIAPEQIHNFGSVTPAADQYALGIVAYEMLAGKAPFDSEELVPLLMMHVNNPPQPLHQLVPTISPALEAVVMRMLAKQPAERFSTAEAVARELEGLDEG